MNTYDQEVFNYLTETENYRSAKQVASQIGQIDDKLRYDFWQEVKENVIAKLQAADAGTWEVSLSLDKEFFSVHRPGWESLGINLDQLGGRPDFGIHCPLSAYDRMKVDELIAHIKQAEAMSKKTEAWPCFRAIDFDFRQQATLENILPARKAVAIEHIAGLFEDFVKKYASVLDRIETETKLPK